MKQNVKVQSVIESLFLSVVERLTKDHALRVINSRGAIGPRGRRDSDF